MSSTEKYGNNYFFKRVACNTTTEGGVSPVFVSAILVFPSHKNSVYIYVRRTAIFCGKRNF
jgi:hypothetical protein